MLERMIELSRKNPRYGYRRVWAMLRREGWRVNKKRVHRLWRKEGLKVSDKLGLTRLHGPIRVKRSGSVKGVEEDGQERQALLA